MAFAGSRRAHKSANAGPLPHASARSDILDLDCDDVTAAKLAVDRQIEHGKVATWPSIWSSVLLR
jgi:hypothetical protein